MKNKILDMLALLVLFVGFNLIILYIEIEDILKGLFSDNNRRHSR